MYEVRMSYSIMNVVIMVFSLVTLTFGASHSQVRDMYNSLILNYTSNIRPVLDQTKPVNLDVNILLHSINFFDEVSGKLSMSGVFQFSWTDELLQWNPMAANGILSMIFTTSHVWAPKVFLANSVEQTSIYKQSDAIEITYHSDGSALLQTFQIFNVVCEADMLYYPNDVHTCKIEVTPITDLSQIHLTSSTGVIMKAYYPNLIWNVESTTKSNVVAGRLSKAILYITFSRRPTFIFLTLVLPIIALNYMNLLVFWIPAESGEKISYSITVLLTFAVYLSVYSEKMPPLSLPIAILSVSMLIKLFTSCLISLCCVVITKISFYQQDHRVPSTLQQLTVCFLRDRKIRGVNKKSTQNDSTIDMGIQNSAALEVGTLCQDEDGLEMPTQTNVGWKEVTIVMDRLCLVFFAVTSTVETIVTVIFIMTRY